MRVPIKLGRVGCLLAIGIVLLGDPIADLTYLLMRWVAPLHERNSLAGLDPAAVAKAQETLAASESEDRLPVDEIDRILGVVPEPPRPRSES